VGEEGRYRPESNQPRAVKGFANAEITSFAARNREVGGYGKVRGREVLTCGQGRPRNKGKWDCLLAFNEEEGRSVLGGGEKSASCASEFGPTEAERTDTNSREMKKQGLIVGTLEVRPSLSSLKRL